MLELLNPEQPTVETQVMGSLLRVRINGQEALVHCEFQTTDSTAVSMPRRMAGYMGRCLAEYGLPLFSHVIYLRRGCGGVWRRPRGWLHLVRSKRVCWHTPPDCPPRYV